MHRPAKLVIAGFLAALGASAHAGYAQLATPPGFGGTPAGWTYAASANDAVFGKVIHQPNGLKVPIPGTVTTMPASYRLAANAPRIAAAAVFLSPHIRAALAIATWLGVAKIGYDSVTGKWSQVREGNSEKWQGSFGGTACLMDSAVGAIRCALQKQHNTTAFDSCSATVNGNVATGGCRYTPTGTFLDQVANLVSQSTAEVVPIETQEEFEDALSPQPMPERVPLELPPGTPLPVDSPVINPEPGPNPQPRPRFVPTGDPVQNPNYDPNAQPSPQNQPYIQPGVRVKPSPTPQEPLRVDLEPVNVPKPTADPTPETDTTEPGTQPKPEDQQSLCEKHPDIVACAKMDEVEPEEVNNEDKTLTITPKTGWGNESATCPAPVTKQVAGLALEMSWQPVCDFASGIRPVVIAMAWLSAALMVLGIARRD